MLLMSKVWVFGVFCPINGINRKIVSGGELLLTIDRICDSVEIGIEEAGMVRYYKCTGTMSKNKKNIPVAIILTFHDITKRTELLNELENKNKELDRLNEHLKDYIKAANQLEEEEEKNRASQEIQKTIGACIEKLLLDFQEKEKSFSLEYIV